MRHQRLDLLKRHALLDRTLHANEADAVLVLEQLADDTNAAIAQVVDVVDALVRIGTVLQIHQILDGVEDVFAPQGRQIAESDLLHRARKTARMEFDPILGSERQLVVQLQAAYAG